MTPREKQGMEETTTRERILDAAVELFSRRGFAGVSVREIAREVGIKESSIYNHFKNKEEILEVIYTVFTTEFMKIAPPVEMVDQILAASTPQKFLSQGIELFKQRIATPKMERIWGIVFIEQYHDLRAREIVWRDIIQQMLDFTERVFGKMMEQNQIIGVFKPRVLAAEYCYPIFALSTEYILLKMYGQETMEIDQRMTEHVEFFGKLLQNKKGEESNEKPIGTDDTGAH